MSTKISIMKNSLSDNIVLYVANLFNQSCSKTVHHPESIILMSELYKELRPLQILAHTHHDPDENKSSAYLIKTTRDFLLIKYRYTSLNSPSRKHLKASLVRRKTLLGMRKCIHLLSTDILDQFQKYTTLSERERLSLFC